MLPARSETSVFLRVEEEVSSSASATRLEMSPRDAGVERWKMISVPISPFGHGCGAVVPGEPGWKSH